MLLQYTPACPVSRTKIFRPIGARASARGPAEERLVCLRLRLLLQNIFPGRQVRFRIFLQYLEYVRIPHTEPIEHEFRWGQRADVEVSKAKILEFMGQLHGQDPQSWSQQYREAHAIPSSSQTSSAASSHR